MSGGVSQGAEWERQQLRRRDKTGQNAGAGLTDLL